MECDAAQRIEDSVSIADAWTILTLQSGYNTTLVTLGTSILGIAAGVVGVLMLLRKRSLATDALSHATLPGVALAFLAAAAIGVDPKSSVLLLLGGTATAFIGLLCFHGMTTYTRLQEDAGIAIVLSVFFGVGIVGLSYIQTNAPAGAGGIARFIYGQASTLSSDDVWLMTLAALLCVTSCILFFKEITLVCFNDAYARAGGWSVSGIDVLILGLAGLVSIVGLQAVGAILVVAMLIIPAVTARLWAERILHMLILSGVLGAASGYIGTCISALFPDKPTGAVIILTSGSFFVLSFLIAPQRGALASSIRGARLRYRIAADHILEHAYAQPGHTLSATEYAQFRVHRRWTIPFSISMKVWLAFSGSLTREAGGEYRLTEQGTARGAQIARNHRLWEQYLIRFAAVAPNHVDWSVDQIEHVLSEELIDALEEPDNVFFAKESAALNRNESTS